MRNTNILDHNSTPDFAVAKYHQPYAKHDTMFRRKEDTIIPDASYPADLKKLGYERNALSLYRQLTEGAVSSSTSSATFV